MTDHAAGYKPKNWPNRLAGDRSVPTGRQGIPLAKPGRSQKLAHPLA